MLEGADRAERGFEDGTPTDVEVQRIASDDTLALNADEPLLKRDDAGAGRRSKTGRRIFCGGEETNRNKKKEKASPQSRWMETKGGLKKKDV